VRIKAIAFFLSIFSHKNMTERSIGITKEYESILYQSDRGQSKNIFGCINKKYGIKITAESRA